MNDLIGESGGRFVLAAAAVGFGLFVLIAILWLMRNRPSSPFIRGGKNRQPRLAVLDAAAVDTRRRLVLVRRDDVEHLILIGGPTDLVIESRITPAVQTDAAMATAAAPLQRPAERQQVRPPAPQAGSPVASMPQAASPLAARQVSAAGPALYGESLDTTARPPAPRQAAPQAPRSAAVAPPPSDQRTTAQPRPAEPTRTANPGAQGVPVVASPSSSPEDILDLARARVLSSDAAPLPAERGSSAPGKLPSEPRTAFEAILDAEAGRMTGSIPASPDIRPDAVRPQVPAAKKSEPTIEEEMNRMLAEIAAKKNQN